jgi:undecaprenyl phosphate-alpha-L-ara4N flippase subunit ArnE
MKIILAFSMMIGCTVMANLLLRAGASAAVPQRLFPGFVDWRVIAGLASFGCAGIVYAWVLQWVPLNIAQSFAAAQYVAVILASALVLSEEVPPARWLGIALIALGIIVVGASSSTPASPSTQSEAAKPPITK